MRMIRRLALAVMATALAAPAIAKGELVLVAGATGQMGMPTVAQLREQGYRVRAMVRDASKGAGLGDETVVADVTKPETLPAALKGVDYVISTLATGHGGQTPEQLEFHGVANLANAAKAAGVKQFVLVSSMNAGSTDMTQFLNAKLDKLLIWKGEGEKALRATGMPYTIVRPGGLERKPCEHGKVGLKIAPDDGVATSPVCRADVAMVLIYALGNKDMLSKTFQVQSDPAAKPDAWRGLFAGLKKD